MRSALEPITVYADHDGIRSNATPLDDVFVELFAERQQEPAARLYGRAFRFEATHEWSRAWEGR